MPVLIRVIFEHCYSEVWVMYGFVDLCCVQMFCVLKGALCEILLYTVEVENIRHGFVYFYLKIKVKIWIKSAIAIADLNGFDLNLT